MKSKILTALPVFLALVLMLTVSLVGCKSDSDRNNKTPHGTFAGYEEDSDSPEDSAPAYSEPSSDATSTGEPTDTTPSEPLDTDPSEPTDTQTPPVTEPTDTEPTDTDASPDTQEPPVNTEPPASDLNDVESILYASEQISTLFNSVLGSVLPEIGSFRDLLSAHEGELTIDLNKFSILGNDLLGGNTLNFTGNTKYDGTEARVEGALPSMQGSPRAALVLDRSGNVLLHFPDIDVNTYVNILPESDLGRLATVIRALLALSNGTPESVKSDDSTGTFPYDLIPYLLGGIGDYISDKKIEDEAVTVERFGNTVSGVSRLTVRTDDASDASLVWYVRGTEVYGMELSLANLALKIDLLQAEFTLYSVTLTATNELGTDATYSLSGRHFADGTTTRGMISINAGSLASSLLQGVAGDYGMAFLLSYDNTVSDGSTVREYNVGFLVDPDGMAFELTVPVTVTETVTEKGTELTVTSKAEVMGLISIDFSAHLSIEKHSKLEVYVETPTASQTVLNIREPEDAERIEALTDSVKSTYPELADLITSFRSIGQMLPTPSK